MDNNTRKLLNLTDDSLIFNEDWLSREARNNRRNMSSTELVDELLSYSSLLTKAYHFIQELKYAYRTNDYVLFLELCSKIPVELPKYFKDKFKIFGNFSQGVMNAFKYSYSNGFLEGINNKIKMIKRVAYGYRNFLLFK